MKNNGIKLGGGGAAQGKEYLEIYVVDGSGVIKRRNVSRYLARCLRTKSGPTATDNGFLKKKHLI